MQIHFIDPVGGNVIKKRNIFCKIMRQAKTEMAVWIPPVLSRMTVILILR